MPADLPSALTAGTITILANTPTNLGSVIQAQLDSQVSQSATQLSIQADAANAAPVLIGMDKNVGTGSPAKYGYSMAAGADKQYGSGPNSAVPVGRFFLFSTAAATLHIILLP